MGLPATIALAAASWLGGVGISARTAASARQRHVPVQPDPGDPLAGRRFVGLGREPFEGQCRLSSVEQDDGVEGRAVAGFALGGYAELVDDREPFGRAGVVAAQPVDHRDGGGRGAEAGCPGPAGVGPAVEEPVAVSERVLDVAGEGFGHEEPRRGEVADLGQQR